MRVRLRLEARFAVCGSCCKVELRKVCVAAVRVRRVELRLNSERYERKRSLCDLFGEVELRVVSAAAAVSWELRFLGRHQGRQRVNAGCCVGPPDETRSRGTSADFEVAVVGNIWSVCGERRRGASVRRDETGNRDRRPASRSLPTLSS